MFYSEFKDVIDRNLQTSFVFHKIDELIKEDMYDFSFFDTLNREITITTILDTNSDGDSLEFSISSKEYGNLKYILNEDDAKVLIEEGVITLLDENCNVYMIIIHRSLK